VLNNESHLAAIQESMNDLMEREHRNLLLRSEAIIREQRTENERLRAERDEARQEICESHCDSLAVVLGSHITPQGYAQRRGWDCYKENTNV